MPASPGDHAPKTPKKTQNSRLPQSPKTRKAPHYHPNSPSLASGGEAIKHYSRAQQPRLPRRVTFRLTSPRPPKSVPSPGHQPRTHVSADRINTDPPPHPSQIPPPPLYSPPLNLIHCLHGNLYSFKEPDDVEYKRPPPLEILPRRRLR